MRCSTLQKNSTWTLYEQAQTVFRRYSRTTCVRAVVRSVRRDVFSAKNRGRKSRDNVPLNKTKS